MNRSGSRRHFAYSSTLCGVATAAVACVAISSASADGPWQLGNLTITAASDPTTPAGYNGVGFDVSAPGVTEDSRGFFAIALHTTASPRGLVMFFTGGQGGSWWTEKPAHAAFADDLRNEGFAVAQVRWRDSWLLSSPGNDAGTAHLGALPATVIKYVHDNYYLPLGISESQVDQHGGGFIITGNSGGATQVSYALSNYGLDDILDVVIPTGGPPHAALAKSLLANPGEEAYQYPLDTRQFIDQGFGYFDGNGPGAMQDPAFIPRWLEESVSTGGNDYYHPDTRIHFIFGDGDLRQQAVGSDYYNRLLAEGSPSVTWEIVPNTGHGTTGTADGRAALWARITDLPGDFDASGVVDGDDLSLWKTGFGTAGSATTLQGDADADQDVDGADFLVWQRQLDGGAAVFSVPEPASSTLIITWALVLLRRCACRTTYHDGKHWWQSLPLPRLFNVRLGHGRLPRRLCGRDAVTEGRRFLSCRLPVVRRQRRRWNWRLAGPDR
ncbi:MAG: hypothetical protein H0T51_15625 [Pirellulales bacterium]|nr:hypothetical protein [Pirellulales bacterium]